MAALEYRSGRSARRSGRKVGNLLSDRRYFVGRQALGRSESNTSDLKVIGHTRRSINKVYTCPVDLGKNRSSISGARRTTVDVVVHISGAGRPAQADAPSVRSGAQS